MIASNEGNVNSLLKVYSNKKSVFNCKEVFFYELLFTCNELRFLLE